MDEVRASTWNELHELLHEGSWNERLGRFRADIAFRGRGDSSEDLRTSLMRLGGDAGLVGRLCYGKYTGRMSTVSGEELTCGRLPHLHGFVG